VATFLKPEASVSPLRALLVGKREEDFFLVREILCCNGDPMSAELDHANSLEEAKFLLEQRTYDLVLFDYATEDLPALELLQANTSQGGPLPFIFLTENADEATVAAIIRAGASDYVEKSQLNGANLARTIRSALSLRSAQHECRSAESTLRKLSRAVEQSADTVMITDRDGIIEYVNPAFERVTGYSRQEAIGQTPQILKSQEHGPEVYRDLWATILSGKVYRGILVNRKKNGELFQTETVITPVRDAEGHVTNFISNGRDLTERLRLESQLLQAQKMDAIGRLAGGVAHDFNNLLTIITSYSELALDSIPPGSPLQAKVQEILAAARRAADLTRQLLAFSRKQMQALRVVDLNQVVGQITKLLPRLIGEDIELTFTAAHKLGMIKADPVQIEQILMNLAANARDAMPEGGRLTIETADVYLDDAYVQQKHAVIPTGHYVQLTVSDNGVGIPPEELPHIFEPFYTTKAEGKGTGLGLATVYGIVKQNAGFIWVYSESGMGTVFKIYLPCLAQTAVKPEAAAQLLEKIQRGTETLLLVEDEDAVRHATAEFLALCGYTVLQAKDGLDALAVAKNHDSAIHLVVTDVVMPHMSGGQLIEELSRLRPATKVLFVSGYAAAVILDHKVPHLQSNFLPKPFTLKALSAKIRQVLGPAESAAKAAHA